MVLEPLTIGDTDARQTPYYLLYSAFITPEANCRVCGCVNKLHDTIVCLGWWADTSSLMSLITSRLRNTQLTRAGKPNLRDLNDVNLWNHRVTWCSSDLFYMSWKFRLQGKHFNPIAKGFARKKRSVITHHSSYSVLDISQSI